MKIHIAYIAIAIGLIIFALAAGLYVWYMVQHVDREVRKGDTETFMPLPKSDEERDSEATRPVPIVQ